MENKGLDALSRLVPKIYEDGLQPATRAVGTALGRTINAALAPVRGLLWTFEQAEAWLLNAVEERLASRGIHEKTVVTPSPLLLNGVLRGVQASGPEADTTLRDSFASLLATAMDSDRTSLAHPAFAEILSQISPGEARAIHSLAERDSTGLIWRLSIRKVTGHTASVPIFEHHFVLAEELGWDPISVSGPYLRNLVRLGLIRTEIGVYARRSDVLAVSEQGEDTHWTRFRASWHSYSKPVAHGLDRFAQIVAQSPPGSEVALTYLRVIPTSFGAQLLRAITDPQRFANANFVSIAMWEDEPDALALK
jgi:hypothetical protein